jgi:hypothetical protein
MVNLVAGSSNATRGRKPLAPRFRKLLGLGDMSRRGYSFAKHTKSNSYRPDDIELWDDSCSEASTPLITPTDIEFDIASEMQKCDLGE